MENKRGEYGRKERERVGEVEGSTWNELSNRVVVGLTTCF